MNTTEKRRAEEMVREWAKSSPPEMESAPEKPQELIDAIAAAHKAVKNAQAVGKKTGYCVEVSRHNREIFDVDADPRFPSHVGRQKRNAQASAAHKAKMNGLIARVWNDDFTFDTLHEELTSKGIN